MNRITSLLLFALLPGTVFAQFYFRAGYAANHYDMKNYNAMVDRYNETRPWLNEQMPHMKWMLGPEVGFGVRAEATGVELYCRSTWGVVQASGSPTSGAPIATRYLRASDTYVGLEGYFQFILKGLAMSVAVEASSFRTKTRVDEDAYSLTDKKMSVGITPGFIFFAGKGFFVPVIRAYYTIPFVKEDHTNTWYILDANNAATEPTDNFRSRATHFGISVSFALGNCAE